MLEETGGENKLCLKHNKLEEYFCSDDNQTVCASCVILGVHKEHKIMTLKEMKKSAEEKLKKLSQLFKEIEITQSKKKMDKYLDQLREENFLLNRKKVNKLFAVT